MANYHAKIQQLRCHMPGYLQECMWLACSSGWEANGEPASWSEQINWPKATGKCTGVCDDDVAACFCNGTFANPGLPRTGPPSRCAS